MLILKIKNNLNKINIKNNINELNNSALLNCVVNHGLACESILKEHVEYKSLFSKLSIDHSWILNRVIFICHAFKQHSEVKIELLKKRKPEKNFPEILKKKAKFSIEQDPDGKIIYPIQINNSVRLLNIGEINTNINFHSDYNLFPMGYKIVRTHSSMFHKGKKCEYTCEISEVTL